MRLVTHLPPRPPRATVPVPQDIHPADRIWRYGIRNL